MRYRGTYIQVDLQRIAANTAALRHAIGPVEHMMAVVKANAYGHGLVKVAQTALKNGADWLGVAIPEEGEALRAAGIDAPILVLGGVNEKGAEASVRFGLTQAVFDVQRVNMLEDAAKRLGKRAQVHIKCDTGMGRIGVRDEGELQEVLSALEQSPHVTLTGAFTHFADADGKEESYSRMQMEIFERFKKRLPSDILFHGAASAAGARFPWARMDMVRQGIALYGCPPVPEAAGVKPALSWYTEIVHVKHLPKGESVSYGCTFTSETDMRVATLPIGYGDGYHRCISGKGQVLIGGKRCPIIGRICMDQMMADVTHLDENAACIGAPVVLLGRQENEEITAGELASWAGTISYEMLLAATARVPVIYGGGRVKNL